MTLKRLRRAVDASLNRPRLAVALFIAGTAVCALGLPRLRLETDGRSLLPPSNAALRFQRQIDKEYATSDFLVVGIEARGGTTVFTPAALGWVQTTTRKIRSLAGVAGEEVRSLSTMSTPVWTAHGLRLEPPLAGPVRNPAEAAEVRRLAFSDPLMPRILVAEDGSGAAIYVPIKAGVDRRQLFHRIADLAEEELRRLPAGERPGYAVHLLGPAAAESLLGEHVLRDMAILLPLAMVVIALVFWLWFRQHSIVAVALAEAASVVTVSLGLMGLMGMGISLVTVVMPVILATYCVADTVHIGQRFRLKCCEAGFRSRRAALDAAMDEVLDPVVFTCLATTAGFLSFALSPIPPLRNFGLFSALGLVSAVTVSALVVPPALLLGGFGELGAPRSLAPWISRLLERGMTGASRRPAWVMLGALLVSAAIGAGALRLRVADSWIKNFNESSPLVRSDRWFNAHFLGSNIVNLVVDGHAPEAANEPVFLADLARIEARLAGNPAAGGALSLADQMRAVGRTLEGRGRLPRSRGEAEEWTLLLRMAGGSRTLDSYVNQDGSAANLWVFLNRADYGRTAAVVAAAKRFAWSGGPGGNPSVRFAGDSYLGYELVHEIAVSQTSSLLVSLVLNLLVVWWMLRSVSGSLLAVLPVSLSILWNFGFMGWVGLPVGVATSMFSAIALGIGVDYAMHWLAKFRISLDAGASWEEALRLTAASSGGAILLNGLVLVSGFGLLMLSSVPPTERLGLLMVVNTVACQLTTLLVLPAAATLLHRWLPQDVMLALLPSPAAVSAASSRRLA
jgi:uncharacterized protein